MRPSKTEPTEPAAERPLLIVGAGGLGRETAEVVRSINERQITWALRGFLDDAVETHHREVAGLPVLGPLTMLADMPEAAVAVCIGNPLRNATHKRVVDRLALDPGRMATLVHPSATVSSDSEIGEGSIVLAQVVMTSAVHVGAHVTMMPGIVLTHDDHLDDFATLGSGVTLGGGVEVGEGAYVGAGAAVREYLKIGAWSVVGMGSVVTRDVPPGQLWMGVPATFVRNLDPDRSG